MLSPEDQKMEKEMPGAVTACTLWLAFFA